METVTVGLGKRAYDILIGAGILPGLGPACAARNLGKRAAIVTNPTVAKHYLGTVSKSLTGAGFTVSVCELPDGERYKTQKSIGKIHDHLLAERLDRRSFIAALGGGVIGDMAGFAAATYLRGIDFVQVPTTVVAQVDSSVGGKTGVNHPAGKNLIGAFHQPRLVYADMDTLATLPKRELLAGIAEVVKYGVIADAAFFDELCNHVRDILLLDPKVMTRVVKRCCELKARVVAEDERETSGRRAILNYGHTVGHALEAVTRYRKYKHGEAVAIGMGMAARIAVTLGRLDPAEADRQQALLSDFGLPTRLPGGLDRAMLTEALTHDKKADDNVIKMILADRIGQVNAVPLTAARIVEMLPDA